MAIANAMRLEAVLATPALSRFGEGCARSLTIIEALPTTEPASEIDLMAIHCVAAERGGLIQKERKKVHG